MEVGKFYQLTRSTGKVIKFKLVKFTNDDRGANLGMILDSNCLMEIWAVSEMELKTAKPIEPFEIIK